MGHQDNVWKWGGCSDNVKFGIKFSKMFIDGREKGDDLQSRVNRHNNEVGRRVSTNHHNNSFIMAYNDSTDSYIKVVINDSAQQFVI